jgi:hypothetical protein
VTDQREPRPDQARDKDVIRRYEVGADIDGREVGISVNDNVLSLHEPADTTFKKPKFVFVFKDNQDLLSFVGRLVVLVNKECKQIDTKGDVVSI